MTAIEPVPLPRHPDLDAATIEALAAGVPDSTRAAYVADVKAFAEWCAETDHCGLPATPETLAAYATYLAYTRHLSPKSIERARWAIRKAHKIAGLSVPDSELLAQALKGYRKHLATTKSPKAKPRKATAADQDALAAMLSKLDLRSAAGKRDAALILLGFAVAARRSELAALDISDIQDAPEGLIVTVYRVKTGDVQEIAVPYAENTDLCPVIAVTRWLDCLDSCGRTEGPLFVRIDQHGNIGNEVRRAGRAIGDASGRMSPQAVGQVVGRKAREAALSGRFVGHSLRRGFATAAHRAGAKKLRIARQGGWDDNSVVLDGYIEDADQWDDNALKGVL
jgi:site-specific recombinase XerD